MTTMAVTINLLYKSTVSRQCNNSHALSIVYSILSRLFTVYTLDCLQYILSIVYSIHSRLFTVYTRFFTVYTLDCLQYTRFFTVYTLDCLQYTAIPSPAVVGTLQMLFMDVFR